MFSQACSVRRRSFDLIVGGAVLDMALMPTREGVVVPEMFNDQ